MSNPTLISIPFSLNGKHNKIYNERQKGQDLEDATWSIGFPPITMTAVEEGGLPPKGLDFNGIFFELSDNTVFLSKGGRYQFDADYAKAIGGYSKGAILLSADRTREYISQIDNNLTDPNDEQNRDKWKIYTGDGSITNATTDKAGVVKLNDTLTSDSAAEALTAKQGKVLKGLVDQKLDKNAAAASAGKLTTARTFNYTGAATGSVQFDGSKDVTCVLTLANSGVVEGTYGSGIEIPTVTVNAKGLLTVVSTTPIRAASTTQTGVLKLNDSVISDSTTEALTARQGKVLQQTKLSVDYPQAKGYLRISTVNNTLDALSITDQIEQPYQGFFAIGTHYPNPDKDNLKPLVGFRVRHRHINGTSTNDLPSYQKYYVFYGNDGAPIKVDKETNSEYIVTTDLLNELLEPSLFVPIPYPKAIPPSGYLSMLGQSIDAKTYPILYKLYGSRLPDMRGEFIRGYDNGRGVDPGRTILSQQYDSVGQHTHEIMVGGDPNNVRQQNPDAAVTSSSGVTDVWGSIQIRSAGNPETRPRNIAFNYIIKAG
ncbi:phage tail protein [Acinetobacter stercoris]|uniref:Phage Tail Collar Domain protein n=1 Tax=Acinetobacter stercoris TaxID=2126983 RepID=A0A2U3N1K7_9GAMM|nr:phage tail protein [Acinetobacter stercoris]SPL71513.1 Phage Tail Collar Domain protein [Acinetobacter stercoris]